MRISAGALRITSHNLLYLAISCQNCHLKVQHAINLLIVHSVVYHFRRVVEESSTIVAKSSE